MCFLYPFSDDLSLDETTLGVVFELSIGVDISDTYVTKCHISSDRYNSSLNGLSYEFCCATIDA